MATGKHFPVQTYSPQNESEEYSKENPYNSVTSFKCYQPARHESGLKTDNKTRSAKQTEKSSVKPVDPFRGEACGTARSALDQEMLIDNTVVSAYRNEKSRVKHTKPRVSHNVRQASRTELQVAQKEIVGNLNEGRYGPESHHYCLSLPEPFNREEDSSTPKSDISDSGRSSAGSRRRLPKVPVQQGGKTQESSKKHELSSCGQLDCSERKLRTDILEKLPSSEPDSVDSANSDEPQEGVRTSKSLISHPSEDKFNSEASKQCSDISAKNVSTFNRKTKQLDSRKDCVSERSSAVDSKVVKRKIKPRVRDRKRSQSLDGNLNSICPSETNRNLFQQTVEDPLKISANQSCSSHCDDFSHENETSKETYLCENPDVASNIIEVDLQQNHSSSSPKSRGYLDPLPKSTVNLSKSLDLAHTDKKSMQSKYKPDSKDKSNNTVKDNPSNAESYSIKDALDDIVDSASERLVRTLPENVFFNFDQAVIQELTDSVMERRTCSENQCKAFKSVSNLETEDRCLESDTQGKSYEMDRRQTKSLASKIYIEGESSCGTALEELGSVSDTKETGKACMKPSGIKASEVESTDLEKRSNAYYTQQKLKVERSPSYRKKVIARAKKKYNKKCSCTKNEMGEIEVCQFCQNYDFMKRSRSSLGLDNAGVNRDIVSKGDENTSLSYDGRASPRHAFTPAAGLPPHPSSKSPRPVRKVPLSSRVDVLMSSDLFSKHLKKHKALLERHTMLYRKDGMKKSVSNLDLSEGFRIDYDSQCETESVAGESSVEPDTDISQEQKPDVQADLSSNHQDSGRNSLADEPDLSEAYKHKNKQTHSRTLPKTVGKIRPGIPSFTQPKMPLSRLAIPSFTEYKQALKEISKSTENLDFSDSPERRANEPKDIKLETTQNNNAKAETSLQDSLPSAVNVGQSALDEAEIQKVELENTRAEQSIPLQLQVIKESDSRESLLLSNSQSGDSNDLSNSTAKSQENDTSCFENSTEIEVPFVSKTVGDDIMKDECGRKNGMKDATRDLPRSSSLVDMEEKMVTVSDKVEMSVTQQNSPANRKIYARPKLKARSMSNSELEFDYQSDNSGVSPRCHSAQSNRERKKPGNKRPRSLISKKSKSSSLLTDTEYQSKNSDIDSNSESVKLRPKLKATYSVNRSKSDSKYELSRGSDPYGEKGRNLVTFDLEDTSCCSPLDIGESETSTSITESFSDSMRSEVNAEDNFKLMTNDIEDNRKLLNDTCDKEGDDDVLGKQLKDDISSQVLRSTSDACEITPEAARKRRERKERPYKSDPFSGTEIIPASKRCALREERAKLRRHLDFAKSSKEEILTFLGEVNQGDLEHCDSFASLEELNEDDEQLKLLSCGKVEPSTKLCKQDSNVSSLSTDSGVIGQEGSHDSQQSSPSNTLSHSQSERIVSPCQPLSGKPRSQSASCADFLHHKNQDCADCGPADMIRRNQLCHQCMKHRLERKETIQEMMDTELNYGRDLNILKEEFYKPILKANLLSKEQLDAIFLNLDELVHVNKHFIAKLKSALSSANQNDDMDLESVMIGCLFLESSTMFLTFENYCVNQAQAPVLLEQLEREKELLRVFLQVSQTDNQHLRRLHLKSFLMVPVQRIMKYPLLLDRLYKTTPRNHPDKSCLKEAKEKIEDILGHINSKCSRNATSFRQRKPSQKSSHQCTVNEKIEVSRVALETLQWNRKDVCDVITSHLQVTQPMDHLWASKRCKNYKFSSVFGVLMTLMQQPNEKVDVNDNTTLSCHGDTNNRENSSSRVQSAAVVMIKERNGRFQVMREPFMLEKCVVSQDPDFPEVFEILEWSKEAYLIKAETPQETKLWVQNLRQQMSNLGVWRKRRNALPNILLNPLS